MLTFKKEHFQTFALGPAFLFSASECFKHIGREWLASMWPSFTKRDSLRITNSVLCRTYWRCPPLTAPSEKLVFGNHRVQYFTFPANVVNSRLQHATLWLYLNGSQSNPVNSDGHIHIYKVVRGEPSLATTTVRNTDSANKIIYSFWQIPKTKISYSLLQKSNWIKINITSLVAEWFHRPEDNLGLAIHSHESLHGTELPIIHYEDASLESAKVWQWESYCRHKFSNE